MKSKDPSIKDVKALLEKALKGMKFKPVPWGFAASLRISEKRRLEQASTDRAFHRLVARLSKRPWVAAISNHEGWCAQTDTGGPFSRDQHVFAHLRSCIRVTLGRSRSFRTGTTEWTVRVEYAE